jgi:16S rRNA (uracil1498-N3)-methyltransferase
MRPIRLFCPTLTEGPVVLSPEESHHAMASLRAQPGREVVLFDGAGGEGVGVVDLETGGEGRAEKYRRLRVQVSSVRQRPFELAHEITLAVAMTKPLRQGYLVEKCTELGVAAIWPVMAERSVGKPTAAAVEKWHRRAVEAAKQSGRAWIPQIAGPHSFTERLTRVGEFSASVLLHTDPSGTPFNAVLAAQPEGAAVLAWVGPEGGWSDAERDRAVEAGVVPGTLGPTVLRTETAAVAVCAAAAMCSVPGKSGPEDRNA